MAKTKYELPPIRHSMRSAFKSCPRKTFWKYVAGVEPRSSKLYFAIGRAFHKGLEIYRNQTPMSEALDMAIATFNKECSENQIELTPEELEDEHSRIVAYLMGYELAYPEDQERVWGEPELEIITRGNQDQGTIDAHFKDTRGFTWIVDDKTRRQMTKDLDMVTKYDEQLLNYAILLTSKGHRVKGVFLRETQKATINRTKKETAEDYRKRVVERYTEEHVKYYQEARIELETWIVESFYHRREETNHVMRQLMGSLHDFESWPWNGDSCAGKYGSCEYLQLCTRRNDSQMNYKPTEWRPLDDGKTRKAIWGYDPSPARPAGAQSNLDSPPV